MEDRILKFDKPKTIEGKIWGAEPKEDLLDKFHKESDVIRFAKEVMFCQLGEDSDQIDVEVGDLGENTLARIGVARDEKTKNVKYIIMQINRSITLLDGDSRILLESVKHECVHIATELKYKESQGHNENFFKEADRMNIFTSAKRVLTKNQEESMMLGEEYIKRMKNGERFS